MRELSGQNQPWPSETLRPVLSQCLCILGNSLHSNKEEKFDIEICAAQSPFQQGPLGVYAVDDAWEGKYLNQHFLSSTKTAEAGACPREFLQESRQSCVQGAGQGQCICQCRARSAAQLCPYSCDASGVTLGWPELLGGVQNQWLYLSNILPPAACCPRDTARWNWRTWGTHFL